MAPLRLGSELSWRWSDAEVGKQQRGYMQLISKLRSILSVVGQKLDVKPSGIGCARALQMTSQIRAVAEGTTSTLDSDRPELGRGP